MTTEARSAAGDTLVDSCVLLDIFTQDAQWREWSERALANARDLGRIYVNPIVYAEVSVRFATVEELDDALPWPDFQREELPYAAGFLAGKAFLRYKRNGGEKRSPLPDFYIGAHAAVKNYRLLTRDVSRYRKHFPRLDVVAPRSSRLD
ncbi:MAG: type II toxin-antitoxin system VapC family toxin [Stackebrandtia sp.]